MVLKLVLISVFTLFSQPLSANPINNYSLQSQDGKSFQLHDIKGNYVVASFVYTRCPMPKMCPLTMSLNKRVFELWKKDNSQIPLKFLIVTLDPEHDTPQRLKDYSKSHGVDNSAFILATGTEKVIDDLSAEFNAIGFPSGGLISHNSKTVLIGPDMTALKDYKDNEWKPQDVWSDIQRLYNNRDKKSPSSRG